MAILSENDRKEISNRLEQMLNPVRIIFFNQVLADCQYCQLTKDLLIEVASLSDNISFQEYNFAIDKDKAELYEIDKIPGTVLCGVNEQDEAIDYGIKLFGIPSGYEFASLLEGIMMISSGESGLIPKLKEKLKNIKEKIHIQVFITPPCPYCPRAVITAYKIALESNFVTAAMVEATEFPELSRKYNVRAVPKIVVNDTTHFEGALPDEVFVTNILKLAGV